MKILLSFDVDAHDVDLPYLISEDAFDVFEAIRWDLNQVIDLRSFLSLISWKPANQGIRWSELVSSSSLQIKETSYDNLLAFSSRLQDDSLPLLEYCLKKGLKGYDTEFTTERLEKDFEKKPAIKQYILANLSKLTIRSNDYLNKKVEVLEGPFAKFEGLVIRVDGAKLIVVVNIFGRDTEVPLDLKQVKSLD